MSSGHNQKPNVDQSLSFEDVSKLFSLPFSEAADILGTSTTVLKKICNENGLERWPHRKYLAGKSIEEIKTEAAKGKSKALGVISPKRNATTALSTTTSPGSHVKDKSPKSAPGNTQEPGNKSSLTWRSHNMPASGLMLDSNSFFEEFKYGFPSGGLSKCTNRWWGGSVNGNDGVTKDDKKTTPVCDKQDEVSKSDNQDEVSKSDNQDEVSLSAVRKRAAEEGKKALKLRALKMYGADKLGNEDKIVLRRLYQTS